MRFGAKTRLVLGAQPRVPAPWRQVLKVADRHRERMRRLVLGVLSDGQDRINLRALEGALANGDRAAAERLALAAFEPDALDALAARPKPLEDRLLDIMQESGNATRCAVRPVATTPERKSR